MRRSEIRGVIVVVVDVVLLEGGGIRGRDVMMGVREIEIWGRGRNSVVVVVAVDVDGGVVWGEIRRWMIGVHS